MKKLLVPVLAVLFFAAPGISSAAYGVQTKTSGCTANQALPDPACTPGAILTTSVSTICTSGYTKTVRDVSLSEAKKVFAEYGIPYSAHASYEVDHLISLELGGSNDISNLWPESRTITNGSLVKDKQENSLHAQVCSGKMTIQAAQAAVATNWLSAYNAPLKTSVVKTPAAPTVVTKTVSPPAKPVTATGPEVKKSNTGICHARGTTYYNATIHYTSFDSLSACLASGGRLPK